MRRKEAENKAKEEREKMVRDERARRPSRFEVIPAPDILKLQRQSATDLTTTGRESFEHVSTLDNNVSSL